MSERMTDVYLPGLPGGSGRAEYGLKSPAEMIAILRADAEREKRNAEAILAARDEDFTVETYVGVFVKRKRQILQEGRKPCTS